MKKYVIIETYDEKGKQHQEVIQAGENAFLAFAQAQDLANSYVSDFEGQGLVPSVRFLHNGYVVSTMEEGAYKGVVIALVELH